MYMLYTESLYTGQITNGTWLEINHKITMKKKPSILFYVKRYSIFNTFAEPVS